MTIEQLVTLVSALPQAKAIGDRMFWNTVVPDLVQQVVDEIAMSHDFDFTLNEFSHTTTGGTTETLTGDNMDLRDIVTIRYDSTEVLQRMLINDAYDLIDANATLGEVAVWYQSGVDANGFPVITIVDTPASGHTLKILYRKKNIPLTAMPNDFGWVIAHGVLSWVNPEFRPLFEQSLRKMIRRQHFGGKDVNLMQMDPHAVMDNNTITDLSGAG